MKDEIEFFEYVEKLKSVTRYKPLQGQHESVAGHIFGTMFVAHDLMDRFDLGLDKTRVFEMLLFHDLPEAGMEFDIPATESAASAEIKNRKHLAETQKMSAISDKFGKPFVLDLFKEFEEKQTKEAIFANLVDKIEAQNHMIRNECASLASAEDFDFIIHFADKFIGHFPQLNMIEEQIQQRLKKFKDGFENKK